MIDGYAQSIGQVIEERQDGSCYGPWALLHCGRPTQEGDVFHQEGNHTEPHIQQQHIGGPHVGEGVCLALHGLFVVVKLDAKNEKTCKQGGEEDPSHVCDVGQARCPSGRHREQGQGKGEFEKTCGGIFTPCVLRVMRGGMERDIEEAHEQQQL